MKFFNRIGAALFAALLAALPIAANAQFADQSTFATAVAGGTASALTVAIPNVVGPPRGVLFKFIPAVANPGAATLNINGTGVKNLLKTSGAGPVALTGGELQPNQIAGVVYDGTQYQLVFISNAAAAAVVIPPQGYLTPCPQANGATLPSGCTAGTLLPTGDVTVGVGQTVTGLVYTPAVAGGNQVPIWNGSQFVNFQFQELTLTIPSSRLANLNYDACLFNNAGSVAIGFTPVWSNSNAGAGNRGTGAGSPQLERKNGIWVNSVSVSVVNGGTTTVVPANQCTYVASARISGTNGVLTFTPTFGQNRAWPIWNAYNRQQIALKAGSPSDYSSNVGSTWRAAGGSAANSLTVFSGLPEEPYSIVRTNNVYANGTVWTQVGIGFNATNVPSGSIGSQLIGGSGSLDVNMASASAFYTAPASLGANVITAIEQFNNTGQVTWPGGEKYNSLVAYWKG